VGRQHGLVVGAARIEHAERRVVDGGRVGLRRVVDALLEQGAERVDGLVAEAGCEVKGVTGSRVGWSMSIWPGVRIWIRL
jgi:hypothetical protein